jgi:predicted amidohydrolase
VSLPMKIAALQMQSVLADVDANLQRIETAAHDAAVGGARLLIAPELAITGYGAGEAFSKLSSPAGGDVAEKLSRIAQATGVAIVAGFAERAGNDVYNSAIFADAAGQRAVYRKSHLYGDYEKSWFKPETPETVLVDMDGIRFGRLICYDVEFPENVRRLAVAGADLVVVPTALPSGASGDFVAGTMIRTRAFENQVFVAYVNHHGNDGAFDYAGQSAIVAPDGVVLAKASATGDALLFAEIDPQAYAASRSENTYLRDLA